MAKYRVLSAQDKIGAVDAYSFFPAYGWAVFYTKEGEIIAAMPSEQVKAVWKEPLDKVASGD